MIKKIFAITMFSAALIMGAEVKSGTVKMQTRIGETAINNVLDTYFAKTYEIPVKGMGNISLKVNSFGVDIQGKNAVAVGYDMVITSDFLSQISNISHGLIKGEIPYKDAIMVRESDLKDAYVTVMGITNTLDAILSLAGITDNVITSSIKNALSNAKGEIELWRQQYSLLLEGYMKSAASNFDIEIKDVDLSYSVGDVADNVVITLKLDIESEKQHFWVGTVGSDKILYSNKGFRMLSGSYAGMLPLGFCAESPKELTTAYNLTKGCASDLVPYGTFRIKAKHGGIITLKNPTN